MKIFNFLSFLILFGCTQLPIKRTDKISILQGLTSAREVEFSIVTSKGRNLRFELRDEEGKVSAPIDTISVSRDFSSYVIYKTLFPKEANKDYNLFIFEGETLVDQRLIGRGQKESSNLKLVVTSSMSDIHKKPKFWDAIYSRHPDYLILIDSKNFRTGDDQEVVLNPQDLWEKYTEARLNYPLFFQQKLIPTQAVWNHQDHGHKEASREIFEAFFAQSMSEEDWNKGFGTGGLLSLGDFNLYFLDGRTYRSSQKDGSHLGLDQTAWFHSKLREESKPSLLIKGDQFFGGHDSHESFEGDHPKDFQDFVTELKKTDTPFVFLSGNPHLNEIMQFPRSLFGRPGFEISAGPLSFKPSKNSDSDNPWRVVSANHLNFTFIESLAQDNHWFLDVESIGENNKVYYKRELAVYIKDLQDNLKEVRKRRSNQRRYRRIKR